MASPSPSGNNFIFPSQDGNFTSERNILITGQKLTGGTAGSGELIKNIVNFKQAEELFGKASHITNNLRSTFDALALSSVKPKVNAIAFDEVASNTQAVYTITLAGDVLKAHTQTFRVGGQKYFSYAVSKVVGDTPKIVLDKLKTLIDADDYSPFTAVVVVGELTLTAKAKGVVGSYTISVDGSDIEGGQTTVIARTTIGAGVEVITNLFNETTGPLKNQRFTDIVYPAGWALQPFVDFVQARVNVANKILDCVGYVGIEKDTTPAIAFADALNCEALVVIDNKPLNIAGKYLGGIINAHTDTISSVAAAISALRLTVGSSIPNYGVVQKTGGAFMAAVPFFNANLVGVLPTIQYPEQDFTDEEEVALRNAGISLFRNNKSETTLQTRQFVTTYKTNQLGDPDNSFKFLEFFQTQTLVREYIAIRKQADFAQMSISTGNVYNEKTTTNRQRIIAKLMEYVVTLATDPDYLLLSDNPSTMARVKRKFEDTLTINEQLGIVDVDALIGMLTQLRAFNTNYFSTFN